MVPGLTVSAGGGMGAVDPSALVSVGEEPPGMVRPVASVMTNCMLVKQLPLVMTSKCPPLVSTGTPSSDTTLGNGTETV